MFGIHLRFRGGCADSGSHAAFTLRRPGARRPRRPGRSGRAEQGRVRGTGATAGDGRESAVDGECVTSLARLAASSGRRLLSASSGPSDGRFAPPSFRSRRVRRERRSSVFVEAQWAYGTWLLTGGSRRRACLVSTLSSALSPALSPALSAPCRVRRRQSRPGTARDLGSQSRPSTARALGGCRRPTAHAAEKESAGGPKGNGTATQVARHWLMRRFMRAPCPRFRQRQNLSHYSNPGVVQQIAIMRGDER